MREKKERGNFYIFILIIFFQKLFSIGSLTELKQTVEKEINENI